jgi:hypothetical protein
MILNAYHPAVVCGTRCAQTASPTQSYTMERHLTELANAFVRGPLPFQTPPTPLLRDPSWSRLPESLA